MLLLLGPVLYAYVCVFVRARACCRPRPPWHSGRTRMHSLVGPGTGRQLNRSAWGNLDWPAGGGRHAAGGSRTGENSNTSDGHALCYTGIHWGTDTHSLTHTERERCTPTPAAGQQERKMIKKLESWGEGAIPENELRSEPMKLHKQNLHIFPILDHLYILIWWVILHVLSLLTWLFCCH